MKSKILFIAFVSLLVSCKNEVALTSNQIIMSGLSYTPNSLVVAPGTTVTWVNNESVTHTVTSDSLKFDSGNMVKGDEFSFTFSSAGVYPYHCKYHPNMTGKIIVTNQVTIANFKFTPSTLTIKVGSSVTWINNDAATHTATSNNSVFDSGDLPTGKSFTYKFNAVGTYPYICIYHPEMVATIIVQ